MPFWVTFKPGNIQVEVKTGMSLLDAARQAGIDINAPCAGQGTCGRCVVRIISGSLQNQGQTNPEKAYLACQSYPASNMEVEALPPAGWQHEHINGRLPEFPFKPSLHKIEIALSPPTLSDNINDADRLLAALKRKGFDKAELDLYLLSKLPGSLRENNWQLNVWMLLPEQKILSFDNEPPLMMALDLGTTSIWIELINAADGHIVAEGATRNPQEGEDVISRIIAAGKKGGLFAQRQKAVEAINSLAENLLGDANHDRIALVSISGNTVMTQILLGLDCRPLRMEPYVPVARGYPLVSADRLGIKANPAALVLFMPAIAAYVGGDVVSGILATRMGGKEPITLFIDLGTNGEIALGNGQWMVASAASAGPAFEGGGISSGMPFSPGAVFDFSLEANGEPLLSVAGNGAPRGICGSGLLALAATLLQQGALTPDGRLRENALPGIVSGEDETIYLYSREHCLGITEADLQNLLRAKAAVYAAFTSLLYAVSMELGDIEHIILAGSFGASLNLAHAITLGLLPELPSERFSYAGNSSLAGARAALVHYPARERASAISGQVTNLELAAMPGYMDHYTAALFFPHTEGARLFPQTWQKLQAAAKLQKQTRTQ